MTTDVDELVRLSAVKLRSEGDEIARDLRGPSVTAIEAVARLMTVHLQESLDTSAGQDIEGTWTDDGGFFTRR